LRRLLSAAIAAVLALLPHAVAAQGTARPTGTFTPGHALRATTPSGSPYSDAGGAAGSAVFGKDYLTELGLTNTGLPFGINDGLTNGPYHRFMLGHQGNDALIVVDAMNGAQPGDLLCSINGVQLPCFGGTIFNETQAETITATGTAQATAVPVAPSVRWHFVNAGTGGIALPACTSAPTMHEVVNQTQIPVRVYPVNGGTDRIINASGAALAANVSTQVTGHTTFVCSSAGQWYAAAAPNIIGTGAVQATPQGGGSTQLSLNPTGFNAMMQQLGYTIPDPALQQPILWTPTDVSGDGVSFASPTCLGHPLSCTVCIVTDKLIHISIEIEWPTNSGTNHPAIYGVPSVCYPNRSYVPHYIVGSVDCPNNSTINIVGTITGAQSSGQPGTLNGPGVVKLRGVNFNLTNGTLSGNQCVMNFTYPRNL
jgi:hypothetical protein